MSEQLQLAAFEPHVGSVFTVRDASGANVRLTLKEAVAMGAPKTNAGGATRVQQFSLLFSGPEDDMLTQSIHALEHEGMDPLELFLVPVAPGQYEAVFT